MGKRTFKGGIKMNAIDQLIEKIQEKRNPTVMGLDLVF